MTLDPRRARPIFLTAADLSAEERGAFLDKACADDPELRRRLDQLLRAHDRPDSVPEAPPDPGMTSEPAPGDGAQSLCPADSPESPGAVVGPYKLVQEIGAGGMGTVYLARQTEPVKRLVALKVIKAGMDSRQVIARFEAERQALALMDHPSIAPVLAGGTTAGGRPYFVVDLVT